jgi:hypothetical protein
MIKHFVSFAQKIIHHPKQLIDLYSIYKSSLFDGDWYLAENPDVAHAKIPALLHYYHYGGFEGRDPSPNFNSAWYLNRYRDVKQTNINPLVHYLRFGKYEGREANSQSGETVGYSSSFSNKENKNVSRLKNPKIFCIGRGKTGTTSLEQVLRDFGYKVGIQSVAELLIDDWAVRDFRRIVQYCETADAFQDVPFSLDFTYQILDYIFPDSKFILTVRNNEDEWYESLVRFHTKALGLDRIPTADDLKNYVYHEKGRLWRNAQYIYGANEETLYDPKIYKNHYTSYNNQVLEYFKYRPTDLLILNLADSSAMRSLCKFLNIKYTGQAMPHLNKSRDQ